MTVVITQGYHAGANAGQRYYSEDVREGHNIGYLGDGNMPVNSITFTPIFGPYPNDGKNTSGAMQNYYGAHYSPDYQTTSNGSLVYGSWMRLGNKKCPSVTVLTTGVSTADTQDYFGNVLPFNWVSCVHDEQPVYMNVGTDAAPDKYVHFQNNFGGLGEGYYGYYCNFQMNDGDEIFSKLPAYSTTNTNAQGLGLGYSHSYKTGGSASYRGFHELSFNSAGSYHVFQPYIHFRRNSTSTLNRYSSFSSYRGMSYLGTYGGKPYYLELSLGQYEGSVANTVACSVHSFDVDTATMTEELNADFTTGTFANFNYGFGDVNQHASGVSDGYWKGPSKWMLSEGGAYRWLFFITYGYRDSSTINSIRMDTGTYAFARTGSNGSGPYLYSYGINVLAGNDMDGTGVNVSDLGGSQSTSKQPGLAASYMDWHGVYDVNNDEKFGPDYTGAACASGNGICNQLLSVFPAYGVQGRADGSSNARHRRIFTYSYSDEPNDWTGGGNGGGNGMFWRGFTTVPETPHNWCWLDEKHTLIAAICSNNTYIYECRGYDIASVMATRNELAYIYYIGNTSNSGADAGSFTAIPSTSTAYTVPGFNGNPTAKTGVGSFLGWVHVNTIPHRVVQMGIDKHGKIFAVTENITNTGGTNNYGGNMHMWTENTPFSVSLGGNVKTDTITYSGSNIDKTLTVEALGIRGRRVKTTVQLEIVGTDGQFDNGTQSKEITTSTSGTVSETITVTGSSQFSIVANFGV